MAGGVLREQEQCIHNLADSPRSSTAPSERSRSASMALVSSTSQTKLGCRSTPSGASHHAPLPPVPPPTARLALPRAASERSHSCHSSR